MKRVNRSTADFGALFAIYGILLVRASGDMFERRFYDAMDCTRDCCFLGGHFCEHLVLPKPAPPHCRAPRPDPPMVCLFFELD